jgi:O-antigen/teichoic acid export membrane protein
MMNEAKKISSAFFSQLILGYGNFAITIISALVLIPLYINTFGLAEYGKWLTVNGIVGLAACLTLNGGSIIIKVMTRYSQNMSLTLALLKKFRKFYIVNLVVLIIFLVVPLNILITEPPETISKASLVFISMALIIIAFLNEYARSVVIGSLRIQRYVIFSLIGKLITLCSILLLLDLQTIIIIPGGILIGEVFILGAALIVGRDYYQAEVNVSVDKSLDSRYDIKTFISNSVGTSSELFTKSAEYPVISFLLGPEVLASYSILRKFADMLSTLANTLTSSMIASTSKYISKLSSYYLMKFSCDYILLFTGVIVSLMTFYICLSPYFLVFWLGEAQTLALPTDSIYVISGSICAWYVSNSAFSLLTINGDFMTRAKYSIVGVFIYVFLLSALGDHATLELIVSAQLLTYCVLFILALRGFGYNFFIRALKVWPLIIICVLTIYYLLGSINSVLDLSGFGVRFESFGHLIVCGVVTVITLYIFVYQIIKIDWVLPNRIKEFM